MSSITDRLESMLAEGRDDPMLRFGLGSAYFNEGRFAEAAGHLEECVRQDDQYSAAYKLLGRALMSLGDNERAKAVFANGLPIAEIKGDKQTAREIKAFQNKIRRQEGN